MHDAKAQAAASQTEQYERTERRKKRNISSRCVLINERTTQNNDANVIARTRNRVEIITI